MPKKKIWQLKKNDGVPVVKGRMKVSSNGRVNLFIFWCPFCKKDHQHGLGNVGQDPHSFLGHRGAHCSVADSPLNTHGYFIELDVEKAKS